MNDNARTKVPQSTPKYPKYLPPDGGRLLCSIRLYPRGQGAIIPRPRIAADDWRGAHHGTETRWRRAKRAGHHGHDNNGHRGKARCARLAGAASPIGQAQRENVGGVGLTTRYGTAGAVSLRGARPCLNLGIRSTCSGAMMMCAAVSSVLGERQQESLFRRTSWPGERELPLCPLRGCRQALERRVPRGR